MEKALKLEPIIWLNNRRELEKRNERARAYSSYAEQLRREAEIEKAKRKEELQFIAGVIISVPFIYGIMLSMFVIFGI